MQDEPLHTHDVRITIAVTIPTHTFVGVNLSVCGRVACDRKVCRRIRGNRQNEDAIKCSANCKFVLINVYVAHTLRTLVRAVKKCMYRLFFYFPHAQPPTMHVPFTAHERIKFNIHQVDKTTAILIFPAEAAVAAKAVTAPATTVSAFD